MFAVSPPLQIAHFEIAELALISNETTAEQPPDVHPCPRGAKCSWGFARGLRASLLGFTPRTDKEQRIWSSNGCGHLSWVAGPLLGFLLSSRTHFLAKSGLGSHERGRAQKAPWQDARHWCASLGLGRWRTERRHSRM